MEQIKQEVQTQVLPDASGKQSGEGEAEYTFRNREENGWTLN